MTIEKSLSELGKEINEKIEFLLRANHSLQEEIEILKTDLSNVTHDSYHAPKIGIWLNLKEYPEAKSIRRAHETDAGWDICSAQDITIPANGKAIVHTGVHFQIPESFEAQIRPRSGLAAKNSITVLNSPGTIDSDYSGEIMVILFNHSEVDYEVSIGDKVAQVVFKKIPLVQIEGLSQKPTNESRGDFGLGSTGIRIDDGPYANAQNYKPPSLNDKDKEFIEQDIRNTLNKEIDEESLKILEMLKEISSTHGFDLPEDIERDLENISKKVNKEEDKGSE